MREAFEATDLGSLPSGDPFFVNLSPARDSAATERMRRTIENSIPSRFAAIAFSGNRGSGKSTELLQLQHDLRASCFALYLNVLEFLNPLDVQYTDLFLLVSRGLLEAFAEEKLELSRHLLQDVEGWFKSVTKESEETVKLSAGVAGEVKAGAQIPFLARLLAKLTADIRAGSSSKVTTRQELDRYFSGLVSSTNTLLAEASQTLQKARRPSQILLLFDNLDRLPPDKSEDLFFVHGSQLQQLACHVVYTMSAETFYSPRAIGILFAESRFLPNVKLRLSKSDPGPNQTGIDALLEVIKRRIEVASLFQSPDVAQTAVELSGGSTFQLMRLLHEAILSAQGRDLPAVNSGAIEEAARTLQSNFERFLTSADYELLAATSVSKSIERTPTYLQLLRNTAIFEYNGRELWYDVNPLIERIDAFQRAKQKLAPKARGGRPRRRG